MKRHGFLALLAGAGVLVAVCLAWLWPAAGPVPAPGVTPARDSAVPPPSLTAPDEEAAESRRQATGAAYAELVAARKALQQKLGDLKTLTWGREWPAQEARAAGTAMMAAQYLLKNPAQLGAFADADEVRAEQARVQAALVKLQEIEMTLGAPGVAR